MYDFLWVLRIISGAVYFKIVFSLLHFASILKHYVQTKDILQIWQFSLLLLQSILVCTLRCDSLFLALLFYAIALWHFVLEPEPPILVPKAKGPHKTHKLIEQLRFSVAINNRVKHLFSH